MRRYRYVGPDEIRARVADQPTGTEVTCASDVLAWVRRSGQAVRPGVTVAATFVVDSLGRLLIADRHSEHVACAGGGDVLSAGEIFFAIEGHDVRVEDVTNQSTGYCPEPESWEAVGRALDRAGIGHPGAFTSTCVFRRCDGCGSWNLVKDGWFFCDVCGRELDRQWNLA